MKSSYRRDSSTSNSFTKDENGEYVAPFELQNRQDILNKRAEFKQDVLLGLTTVLTMGILFGFFMNKARVFDPFVIRDQFKFERFIMLKMFCAAAGTSCFALTIGHYICSDVCLLCKNQNYDKQQTTNNKLHHWNISKLNYYFFQATSRIVPILQSTQALVVELFSILNLSLICLLCFN